MSFYPCNHNCSMIPYVAGVDTVMACTWLLEFDLLTDKRPREVLVTGRII